MALTVTAVPAHATEADVLRLFDGFDVIEVCQQLQWVGYVLSCGSRGCLPGTGNSQPPSNFPQAEILNNGEVRPFLSTLFFFVACVFSTSHLGSSTQEVHTSEFHAWKMYK